GIVVFVNHRIGRRAADRCSARVYKPFEVATTHGLGDRERAPDVGGANPPAVSKGRASRQVKDVFDAVQLWRAMPVIGKKIAAQYLNVLGERVDRLELRGR